MYKIPFSLGKHTLHNLKQGSVTLVCQTIFLETEKKKHTHTKKERKERSKEGREEGNRGRKEEREEGKKEGKKKGKEREK